MSCPFCYGSSKCITILQEDELNVIPENFDPAVAFKDDETKVDLSLLPYRPLSEIAEVLQFGTRKYARNNWRKGFNHERLLAAILRHLFAYNEGETYDPETGLCHLAHAGCMLLFLMETRHTHPELDHRFKEMEANVPHGDKERRDGRGY